MRLRVRFDPHAPLLLGTGTAIQQVRESSHVIPGGAVLGAVAHGLLQAEGSLREDPFVPEPEIAPETARLLSELRFSSLYPVPATLAGEARGRRWQDLDSYRAPSSARTCKRRPGFRETAGELTRRGDGVTDLLLHLLGERIHAAGNGRRAESEAGRAFHCPVNAEHRLERFRSLVYRQPLGDGGWSYGEASLPTEPRVRVGLSRYTEAAEDGILFQVEPVEPRPRKAGPDGSPDGEEGGFVFLGDAWLPDELWPQLQARLGAEGSEIATLSIAVGGARARGYGEGLLTLVAAPPAARALAVRMDRFVEACQRHVEGPDLYLPALLRAPWPLVDPARNPGAELLGAAPPPARLGERLRFAPELSVLETEPWGGWSMAWGLPRTRRLALAPGSVVVLNLSGYEPDRDREPLLQWLSLREERPAGPESGTGWLTWFEPFHLDHSVEKEVSQ